MNQEACCTCARLLGKITSTSSTVGSKPPPYSASTAESDSYTKSRGKSSDKRKNEGGIVSGKTATYTNEWEKNEEGGRQRLSSYDREPENWQFESEDSSREKEEGGWKAGGGRGRKENRREDRKLSCCGRIICGECIEGNERFGSHCPFCQVRSRDITSRDGPPSYESICPLSSPLTSLQTPPTIYAQNQTPLSPLNTPDTPETSDTIHHLAHPNDTPLSLSLRYKIPIEVLRKKNRITSDHLLLARKTILIPGEWYKGGESLSPRPVEGEEEERRKWVIRKFMVGCKVFE
ncbi:hypothetical protein EYC80_002581 [Monilinia laxa]|nr:hypothetical protein EYC80_002581 [Monilinia laxa]